MSHEEPSRTGSLALAAIAQKAPERGGNLRRRPPWRQPLPQHIAKRRGHRPDVVSVRVSADEGRSYRSMRSLSSTRAHRPRPRQPRRLPRLRQPPRRRDIDSARQRAQYYAVLDVLAHREHLGGAAEVGAASVELRQARLQLSDHIGAQTVPCLPIQASRFVDAAARPRVISGVERQRRGEDGAVA